MSIRIVGLSWCNDVCGETKSKGAMELQIYITTSPAGTPSDQRPISKIRFLQWYRTKVRTEMKIRLHWATRSLPGLRSAHIQSILFTIAVITLQVPESRFGPWKYRDVLSWGIGSQNCRPLALSGNPQPTFCLYNRSKASIMTTEFPRITTVPIGILWPELFSSYASSRTTFKNTYKVSHTTEWKGTSYPRRTPITFLEPLSWTNRRLSIYYMVRLRHKKV